MKDEIWTEEGMREYARSAPAVAPQSSVAASASTDEVSATLSASATPQQRCAALRRDGWWHFFENRFPVCPHCGSEIDVGKHDLYRIYEEGEHEIDCPYCNLDLQVSARIRHTFNTDRQD